MTQQPSLESRARRAPFNAVDERVRGYVRRAGLPETTDVVMLTADASDRRYVRLVIPARPSVVLAVHAGPIDPETLPFINVHRLLRCIPAPVPEIRAVAADLGILVLEDLGDVTFEQYLQSASPDGLAARYREAVDLIALLQRRGRELTSPAFVPYGLAFDVEKLTWELEFFIEHFLGDYRGARVAPDQLAVLRREFAAIAEELAAEPRVLCHRDFHSRNLMLHQGRLWMLDFQDARMGPATYDLASLLRDSYVDLPEAVLGGFLEHYLATTGARADEFRRRFDLMCVQRHLKALGTFGYQVACAGRHRYAAAIPRTLGHLRRNLHKYDRFARLRTALIAQLPELA